MDDAAGLSAAPFTSCFTARPLIQLLIQLVQLTQFSYSAPTVCQQQVGMRDKAPSLTELTVRGRHRKDRTLVLRGVKGTMGRHGPKEAPGWGVTWKQGLGG